MDQFPLEGRTALVTGASRGIGAASALALDRAGARVALVARDSEALLAIAGQCEHSPLVVAGDLGEADAPAAIVAQVLSEFGGVDVLVNNAAAAARLDTVDTDAALIDRMLAVNIRAPLLLIAALVPSMIERGGGSIVNLSSVSGLVGTPRRAAYAASKGGLDAATRSLAIELGPSGIRVNSVAPGVVDTALWAKNKTIPGCGRDDRASDAPRPVGPAGGHRRRGRVSRVGCRPIHHRRDDLRRRRDGSNARPLWRLRVRRNGTSARRLRCGGYDVPLPG
jgi:NAD(P)-dependent dehydrogenase (short-subunit alcohol dehydrogenase family)